MGEIITSITGAFSGIITGLTSAIRDAVSNLLFDNTGSEQTLSDFAKFAFTLMGLGMAIGVVYLIVRWVRNRQPVLLGGACSPF